MQLFVSTSWCMYNYTERIDIDDITKETFLLSLSKKLSPLLGYIFAKNFIKASSKTLSTFSFSTKNRRILVWISLIFTEGIVRKMYTVNFHLITCYNSVWCHLKRVILVCNTEEFCRNLSTESVVKHWNGCAGKWWNHHSWKCLLNNRTWHSLVDMVVFSKKLDLMILDIFSSLNDQMIL